jgi:hypothetical protein
MAFVPWEVDRFILGDNLIVDAAKVDTLKVSKLTEYVCKPLCRFELRGSARIERVISRC